MSKATVELVALVGTLQQRGWSNDEIMSMNTEQAFIEYCEWNGLADWGLYLWEMAQFCQQGSTIKDIITNKE